MERIIGKPIETVSSLMTISGKFIDMLDPDPDVFDIEDIAHSLANQCRFGGHSSVYYSVAQHCCLCSVLVPNHLKLTALLHDATEAYLVDIPKPLKNQLPNYMRIEHDFMKIIATRYGLIYNEKFPEEIHQADLCMLELEWNKFTIGDKVIPRLINDERYMDIKWLQDYNLIRPKSPQEAKDDFLTLYHQYSHIKKDLK